MMLKRSAAIAASLLIAPVAASAHPHDPGIVFEQPKLKGVPGEFFVPSSAVEKHRYPTTPAFKLIFWQGNPFRANGELVPSTWDAGAKTGLDVGPVPEAQYSLKATGPSSTVQITGGEVGAYLNSADLAGSRFRADPAMMITPVIDLPNRNIFPFSTPTQRLYQSLTLRVPTAVSQNRRHNIVYVVSDFLFIDRTTGTRITFEVALFHHDRRSPRLTRAGLASTEVGLYDPNTKSFQVGNPLSPLSRLNEPAKGSALYANLPWRNPRPFAFTISSQNFMTGLRSLKAKGAFDGSMNPADYALRQWHLNAEMQYDQSPTELGWSLSDARIGIERGGDDARDERAY